MSRIQAVPSVKRSVRSSTGRRAVALAGWMVAACTLGCQSYTPRPLAPEAPLEVDLFTGPFALEGLGDAAEPTTVWVDLTDGVTPSEAMSLAVVLNPELRAARARRGLAAAQLIQAGLLPNPQLSLAVDQPTGGATTGTVTAVGLGLGWDFGALIEHRANLSAAQAKDRAAAQDMLWQEWLVACSARLATAQAAALDERLQLLARATAKQEAIRASFEEWLAEGQVSVLEVRSAELALAELRTQLQATRSERDLAVLAVSRAIGLAPNTELFVSAEPFVQEVVHPEPQQLYEDALVTRVDLSALRYGYDSQEERVRAAVLAQFPRLSLGPNFARDTGNVQTLGLGVSLDLPIFDRGQGRIAGERATRDQLFEEYNARCFALRADLFATSAELVQLDEQLVSQAQLVELGRARQAELEALLRAGLVDRLAFDQAWAADLPARLTQLALAQRATELRISLETMTGHLQMGNSQ